ncbi:lysophospholipid acyltransferase family protein [Mobilicoccus caccae]|uniref:1-acyl-sn-glycerol-3-phosphate acyltransferase n=1 Tax=Mobilicoccus caccae TaxID=1859295 RepID=A0ABQ6IQ21_9MICO|nr:lysophospholipid acyltransferase family protein [Mobilicoccus caccae]GMA39546.1 1-acyl-sn-glycerol-3-phosphate acyltransferase [Mobilicoccus caccae]
MEPVYTPVIGVARTLFAAEGLRFRLSGTEHFPTTGGGVVVMNHLSYLDFAYAGLAARPAGRVIRFMCKDTIFDHPVAGPLMRGMKHIPVDRESGSASFRAALTALKAGELIGVFPEATISRSFELKEFKSGAIRMAQAARVPLIPVVLWGSQRVWTKGHPKRLGRTNTPISIDVGEPMVVERRADTEAAMAELRSRMTTMLHAAQDAYPTVPWGDRAFIPARLGGTAPTLEEATALDLEDIRARREKRLREGKSVAGDLEETPEP